MEFVYLCIFGSDWDETIIILSKEDAIKHSIEHPNNRIEIFCKTHANMYIPTYSYYQNGILFQDV